MQAARAARGLEVNGAQFSRHDEMSKDPVFQEHVVDGGLWHVGDMLAFAGETCVPLSCIS